MGDYTVSGFYSRIPIKPETDTVAILCVETPFRMSTHPCYLQSNLTPVMMPVHFTMNDYGGIDEDSCEDMEYLISNGEYIENENELLIRRVCGMSIFELINTLNCTSEYKTYDDVEAFQSLQKRCQLDIEKPAFHFIYEHASIYNLMAGQPHDGIVSYVKKYSEKFFHKNMFYCMDAEYVEFDHQKKVEENGLSAPYQWIYNAMNNAHKHSFMSLYNKFDGNWGNLAEDIAKWCSFVLNLDNVYYGSFGYSTYGGQKWHHDEVWKKERIALLDKMKELL